jgi:hypothetical protein
MKTAIAISAGQQQTRSWNYMPIETKTDSEASSTQNTEQPEERDVCPDCGCDINGPTGCLCDERIGREDYYRRNGW